MPSQFSSGKFQKKVRSLINITKLTTLSLGSSNKVTPESQETLVEDEEDEEDEDEEIDVFISGRNTK